MRAKFILTLAPTLFLVLALGLGEIWARSLVPRSDQNPFRTSPHDELPSVLAPNLELQWQGPHVQTNSLGFRGPEIPEPNPKKKRIAILGDSFVFGSGVEWEGTIGVQLERSIQALGRQVDVLNFGVPGYNTGHNAWVLENKVLEHAPDLVVYVAFANDTDAHKSYGIVDPERIPDPLALFFFRSALSECVLVGVRGLVAKCGVLLNRHTPANQAAIYNGEGGQRVRDGLIRMRAACKEAGIPLVTAIYPFMVSPSRNPYLLIEQGMARDAAELGLPVVRLERAFSGVDRRQLWANPIFDSHPSHEANALVGKWMGEAVAQILDRHEQRASGEE